MTPLSIRKKVSSTILPSLVITTYRPICSTPVSLVTLRPIGDLSIDVSATHTP